MSITVLPAIRWPIIEGQGWPITIEADSVELPSLSSVVSATIKWRSGDCEPQTRDLLLDEDNRTSQTIPASYIFASADNDSITPPELRPSELRAYVVITLSSGAQKESKETIVLRFNPEFA